MKKFLLLSIVLIWATSIASAQSSGSAADVKQYKPMQTQAKLMGAISPLRDLPVVEPKDGHMRKEFEEKENYFTSNTWQNPNALPQSGDPLAKNQFVAERGVTTELIPGLNFEGLRNPNWNPPNPTGDIGKNHYVQMVEDSDGSFIRISDKAGNPVTGTISAKNIWNQVNGSAIGDPIVQYDHDAERWLIMEMQDSDDNQVLIAISDTDDPTGSWKAYRIQCLGSPNYPKLYVWHNAYFITANENIEGSSVCSGYALDRADMLGGAANITTWRFEFPNFLGIQFQPATGADWEGGPPPPPGSPGYIFRVYDDAWAGGGDKDQIQQWNIYLNWQDTSQNYAEGPIGLDVTPFETRVCFGNGIFDCIEQPDATEPRLMAFENIIMYRAPYRNFGTHESIVMNHVSDISDQVGDGGDAAVRWYELRRLAGQPNWSVYQEGTYAPDATNRFTGTLSIDAQGNIGLGYTVASETVYPGIRITGRRNIDPLGQMTVEEYSLVEGGASHSSAYWGKYSNMAVDPVDGRTFWFTAEYMDDDGSVWATRVGSFQIRRDSYDLNVESFTSPVSSTLLGLNEPITVRLFNGGYNPAYGFSLQLTVNGVDQSIENYPDTIQPGQSVPYTFGSLVSWTSIGEEKTIRVNSSWAKDEFNRNDTIQTNVRKLTSFDAAIPSKTGLPGLVCASEYNFGLIIRNTSGLPMDSVQVNWRLNNGPTQSKQWKGYLLPGQRDTVEVTITGLVQGSNTFEANTSMPNGQPDQDATNDTLSFPISANLNGAFMTLESETTFGVLSYEIRKKSNNELISSGEIASASVLEEICIENNTCYRLKLTGLDGWISYWKGVFRLRDIFGDILVEEYVAYSEGIIVEFCAPQRKLSDVGAVALVSPKTGAGLTNAEPVTVLVRNFGLTPQNNIAVSWKLGNGSFATETFNETIVPGGTKSFTFANSTANLSTVGLPYDLELQVTVSGDEDTTNDLIQANVTHLAPRDVEIVSVRASACDDPNNISVEFTVLNKGLDPVTDIEVSYLLNGMPGIFQGSNFNIAPGSEVEFSGAISQITPLFGLNNLQMDVTDVNMQGQDFFDGNDKGKDQFYIYEEPVSVQLLVQCDDRPPETSWQLLDNQGTVIESGSNYTVPLATEYQYFCLAKDSCYTVRLFDSGGNGLIGNLQVNRTSDFALLWIYNGYTQSFTDEISGSFCATSACTNLTATLYLKEPTGTLANGRITVAPSGGIAPYQINLNDGPYQSQPFFNGLAMGTYKVGVRDNIGCIYEETVTLMVSSADEPDQASRALDVFPNPTDDVLWASMPAKDGETEAIIQITDMYGRLIRQSTMARLDQTLRGEFILENVPSGVYLLTAKDTKGLIMASKRFVKQ